MNSKFNQGLMLISVLTGITYVSILQPKFIFFLLLFASAIAAFHTILQLVSKYKRPQPASNRVPVTIDDSYAPKVSIHIPVSNEPPELVIRTLKACLSQNYKNFEVIILDNNTSDAMLWKPVEKFCDDKANLKFYRVPKLDGFKAGALEKCLQLTTSRCEYVMVIDADYCLKPNALYEAVSEAQLKKIDLLQFPQAYRNINANNESLAMDYQHYFDIYASAANVDRAMLSTGTLCLFRYDSLMELPGWKACRSITEDAEIGLQFIKAGKRTAFDPRILGYGIMPQNVTDIGKQRTRWMFGNMQTLIANKWNVFSKRDRNIITQLTAWVNFLIPAYVGLFMMLSLGAYILNRSELELSLWMGIIPFILFITGKCILYDTPSLSITELLRVLAIHLHFNFRSSFVWLPCLLGVHKPFYKTPKNMETTGKGKLQFSDFIFLIFLANGILAFLYDLLLPGIMYFILAVTYLLGTLYTWNVLKDLNAHVAVDIKLQTKTL